MEGMNPISLEEFLACAIFGAVFTYTAVRGMSAIEKVATVFSPLILIVAVIAGVVFISQAGGVGPFLNEAGKLGGMGLGDGITIVVGSWIAGAIMGVDMFLSLIHIYPGTGKSEDKGGPGEKRRRGHQLGL